MYDLIKRADAVNAANNTLEPDQNKKSCVKELHMIPSQGKIAQVGKWKVHYIGKLSQTVYEHEDCGHIQLHSSKYCAMCGEQMIGRDGYA